MQSSPEINEESIDLRRGEVARLRKKEESKENCTKKLYNRFVYMLWMMAGSDCHDERCDVSEDLKTFLNYDSAKIAEQGLYNQFKSRGKGDVGFVHGTVREIYNGNFQYHNERTTSNFSAFNFLAGPFAAQCYLKEFFPSHNCQINWEKQISRQNHKI